MDARMDEQSLEAQGVAAHGARRNMVNTFEVVRRNMVPSFFVSSPFSVFACTFTSTGLQARDSYLIFRDTCRRACPFLSFMAAAVVVVMGPSFFFSFTDVPRD
jgi:hypothetical protein